MKRNTSTYQSIYAATLMAGVLSIQACSNEPQPTYKESSETSAQSSAKSKPNTDIQTQPENAFQLANSTGNDSNTDINNTTNDHSDSIALKQTDNVAQSIDATHAGSFAIGERILVGKQKTGELVQKKTITRMEEGEQIVNDVFEVYKNNQLVLKIKGSYDQANQPTNIISDIEVLSAAYKTDAGIGIGSSLASARRSYPNNEIYYSYVCDCIWLENGTDYQMQFHIDKHNYQKTLPTHVDSVALDSTGFDTNAKIKKVRIYGLNIN